MEQSNKNTIISRLKVGTYTYSQLMELVEWCNHNKNPHLKASQMLELQRHCLYEVVGKNKWQRYHILEVYDKPTTDTVFYEPRVDYANHPQVLVPSRLLENGSMIIYKIQFGNMVYIGSTMKPRGRISKHFNGHVNEHTYHMLQRGGTFELLEHITTTEEDLRAREIEYIKEYKACGMFIVINNQHAKA